MYERFTDRARKVMQLAQQEARKLNHEYVGAETVFLGLIAEGSGVAANVLKNLDVDLRKARNEVQKLVQPGTLTDASQDRLPLTPRAKKVLDYAIEEARTLNHNYVGTEHIILGLLREQEGVAAQVLMNLGLKLEDVREETMNLLGLGPAQAEADKTKKLVEALAARLGVSADEAVQQAVRVYDSVLTTIERERQFIYTWTTTIQNPDNMGK